MATGKYHRWQTPEGLGLIEAWARDGLTDEQLAKAMGVSRNTFYKWIKEFSDIRDALTRGRGGAREQIENALMKKATGYTVTVKEPVKIRHRYWNEETQSWTVVISSGSGGFVVQDSPPDEHDIGWVDTSVGGVMKYWNGNDWTPTLAVWG